eukprot:3891202-Rhodomonas_salina.1
MGLWSTAMVWTRCVLLQLLRVWLRGWVGGGRERVSLTNLCALLANHRGCEGWALPCLPPCFLQSRCCRGEQDESKRRRKREGEGLIGGGQHGRSKAVRLSAREQVKRDRARRGLGRGLWRRERKGRDEPWRSTGESKPASPPRSCTLCLHAAAACRRKAPSHCDPDAAELQVAGPSATGSESNGSS